MTTTEQGRSTAVVWGRSDAAVLADQLRGIDAWTRAHDEQDLSALPAASREARLDLARRRDVVTRQRQAIVDWTDRQLRAGDHPLRAAAGTRAVLAHRSDWFKRKVGEALQAGGVTVVADLENGADALGVVVAEQPDLLLVEDKLPMVNGLDLTRGASRYSPSTVVVVQVADEWQIGPFLDAGATSAYTRRTPPALIAVDLLAAVAF